jgi:hypothetical protein
MDDVGIFVAILSILRANGILYGHLIQFLAFWYVLLRKIWQPCFPAKLRFPFKYVLVTFDGTNVQFAFL